MKQNIRISGPAGMGINTTAEIILNIGAKLGYDVISDIEYESRIKGGTNYYDVMICESGKFISKYVDILIAFNDKAVEKNINSLNKNSILIINKKYLEKFGENSKKVINENNIKILDLAIEEKYDNTYLLGILTKLLNIPFDIVKKELTHIFEKKGEETINKNIQIVKNILDTYEINFSYENKLTQIGEPKNTIYGNKAIAYGAIEGGLEFYSAYPMTPASTILTEIINSNKIKYLQAEDEIAVINSALGSSFTGARSMVGTSGGGFALMTEALSFAIQAEIPITAVLSQRAGPSTGTPTYFEQGDLNFALNPTFGDFNHVLLCPSSIEEAYYFGGLALNIADKYQTIVLILIDKQLSEAFTSFSELKVPKIDRGIILDNPNSDYKRYELTENGISPRVKVGTINGDFIATSYEHDEYGATTESSELKVKMTEKRIKKLDNFYEKEGLKGYEIYTSPQPSPLRGEGERNSPKKMLITMGLTSYTAKEFVKNNPEFGLIIINIIKPIDERLYNELKDKEEIIFVESNYSGQLENYIGKELGLKHINGLKISHLRKYDLFPFYIEDFNDLK